MMTTQLVIYQRSLVPKSPKINSEYVKLIHKGAGRGRQKTLTAEQFQQKNEITAQKNRLRQEARRRALMVLQHRHSDEYAQLYNSEQEFLQKENTKTN